ncbi:MAG: glycosyltransferase family 4 protein [Pseudomonadota bacterium]
MKIAVVIQRYGLIGGSEGFAYELTERLAQREGAEIHVYAHHWRQNDSRVHMHRIPRLLLPTFLKPIGFARLSNRITSLEPYDIVHGHEWIFGMNVLSLHGIPHRTWMKSIRRKRLSFSALSRTWLEKRCLMAPRTPLILPVSNLVRDELLKAYRIPERRIRVIYPGISAERFHRLDRENCRREIRERHGLLDLDIVILFVGMNFEIKRLDLVLRGVANLVSQGRAHQKVKVLVVGKGDIDRYTNLAAHLGISNRLIFAGVTREIEKYYLASDVFAMPSQFDTFGMAVLEAMAGGLPVVITEKVGAKDLVDDGVQGFVLADEPSPAELSKKIDLLMDRERRQKMGRKAREMALLHTWEKTASQVWECYKELKGH